MGQIMVVSAIRMLARPCLFFDGRSHCPHLFLLLNKVIMHLVLLLSRNSTNKMRVSFPRAVQYHDLYKNAPVDAISLLALD